MKDKTRARVSLYRRLPVPAVSMACGAAGLLLYGILEFSQGGTGGCVSSLKRAPHGEGQLQYEVMVKGLGKEGAEVPVTIPVEEKQYSKEEADKLFDGLLPELAGRILGKNQSLEAVRSDLNLIRVMEAYGFYIRWETEDMELVDSFGAVHNEGVTQDGKIMWLKAAITDGIHTRDYQLRIRVLPPLLTSQQQEAEKLKEVCIRLDGQQQTDDELKLPKTLEGRHLSYYMERGTDYTAVPVLGILLAALIAMRKKVNEQNEKKKRESLLLLDYSEVVSKFMVFTGAGMTIRTAWERIAKGYEESVRKGGMAKRPAYEEICRTFIQLQSKTPEGLAYAEFGQRCRLQPYVKLAALLEQNRKTGGKTLKSALELEMVSAFEQRKNLAKKLGEEAGTKLLLPLFLMLGVVMVMIVVPAFLAFY